MNTRQMNVSPSMAQTFLDNQIGSNRPLNSRHVAKLARQISNGLWKLNGEALKFNRDGKLIDGQHRCAAIIKSGRTVETLIVENVSDDSFETIDNGRTRTATDFMHGVTSKFLVAATARWIYAFLQNDFPAKTQTPSNQEILNIIDACPGLEDSIRKITISERLGKGSFQAFIHYYYTRIVTPTKPVELVDGFFHALATGESLTKSSPVYQLRERLISDKMSSRKSKDVIMYALVIKAMKAYLAGRTVKLTFQPTREDFPNL